MDSAFSGAALPPSGPQSDSQSQKAGELLMNLEVHHSVSGSSGTLVSLMK